jgi:hypothetical protein
VYLDEMEVAIISNKVPRILLTVLATKVFDSTVNVD